MSYDIVIKNGTIVDGTGRRRLPRRPGSKPGKNRRDRQGKRRGGENHRRLRSRSSVQALSTPILITTVKSVGILW